MKQLKNPSIIFLIIACALIPCGILIHGFTGGVLLGIGATIVILFLAAAFIKSDPEEIKSFYGR